MNRKNRVTDCDDSDGFRVAEAARPLANLDRFVEKPDFLRPSEMEFGATRFGVIDLDRAAGGLHVLLDDGEPQTPAPKTLGRMPFLKNIEYPCAKFLVDQVLEHTHQRLTHGERRSANDPAGQ